SSRRRVATERAWRSRLAHGLRPSICPRTDRWCKARSPRQSPCAMTSARAMCSRQLSSSLCTKAIRRRGPRCSRTRRPPLASLARDLMRSAAVHESRPAWHLATSRAAKREESERSLGSPDLLHFRDLLPEDALAREDCVEQGLQVVWVHRALATGLARGEQQTAADGRHLDDRHRSLRGDLANRRRERLYEQGARLE